MTRLIAVLLVALLAGASARLLACGYACFDHTRAAASSQPACHEQAHQPTSPALSASQNECDDQPFVLAGFLVGKITSIAKPSTLALHMVGFRASPIDVGPSAQPRAPARSTFTPSHATATQLRI